MHLSEVEYKLDDNILTQRLLKLKIGGADVRLCMDNVAAKLRGEVNVAGFRKGKAPLSQVRKQHHGRVTSEAFEILRSAAMNQVISQLKNKDQPLIPPEVLDRDKIKLRYGRPLEFTVKYLVDPSGMGHSPEQLDQANAAAPGLRGMQKNLSLPLGIPTGPQLPKPPALPEPPAGPDTPDLPKMPLRKTLSKQDTAKPGNQ